MVEEEDGVVRVKNESCKVLTLAVVARWVLRATNEDATFGGSELLVGNAVANRLDAESVAESWWRVLGGCWKSHGGGSQRGEEGESLVLHFC